MTTHVVAHYTDPVTLCCDRDVLTLVHGLGHVVEWGLSERVDCDDALELVDLDLPAPDPRTYADPDLVAWVARIRDQLARDIARVIDARLIVASPDDGRGAARIVTG